MNGREYFKKFNGIIIIISKTLGLVPKKIRINMFTFFRNVKGKKGMVIRYCILKSIAVRCGSNVSIHEGCYIYNLDRISLGSNVSIHPLCYIDCKGILDIGDNVSIAHGVTIMTTNHYYERKDIPIKYQGLKCKKVVIKDDVWIGAKSTILCGNTIESGSIIGAASVVTHDIKENSIVAGIPIKLIKER